MLTRETAFSLKKTTVNRRVVSSSLTCGANQIKSYGRQEGVRLYFSSRFSSSSEKLDLAKSDSGDIGKGNGLASEMKSSASCV